MAETKIIYHIDEEETPYLVKLPIPPDQITLGDFKNVLNRPNYKFFFKSMDDDFGVVKEEIVDDGSPLPCFNGRVISWLVSAESSLTDSASHCAESVATTVDPHPPNYHPPHLRGHHGGLIEDYTTTETESVFSSKNSERLILNRTTRMHRPGYDRFDVHPTQTVPHGVRHRSSHGYESSSMMSSDLESTSFVDSEEDASSRFTTTTDHTSVSRQGRHRRQRRRRPRLPPLSSRTSSFSSITDSTMSLNIITVTLNMDTVNFLGISIVGQSNQGGDGGIYVGSIMKGGAVALDGRIEPGDMILQVNDISFENMSNDDAVRVLREVVQKPGPVKLVVAKCWDPSPKGYFTIPRTEPVRPIDPSAWVAHTEAARADGGYPSRPPSVAPSQASTLLSSLPESERPLVEAPLTVHSDLMTIAQAMARPNSGLEVRNRLWLKITIPNAFIGSEVVDWLHSHVQGLEERRDARKMAAQLLRAGLIRHTVNKVTFSEQCYYVFGDLCSGLASLRLSEDPVSGDTLGPLPNSGASVASWGGLGGGMMGPSATPTVPYYPTGYAPIPYAYSSDPIGGPFVKDGSVHSGSGSSGSGGRSGLMGADNKGYPSSTLLGAVNPLGPGAHESCSSSGSSASGSSDDESQLTARNQTRPLPRPLNQQAAAELSGSRQSFRAAMTNPCEYFVDVM